MVIGCVTIARLGDIYGRRPVFLITMLLNSLVVIILIFNKNELLAYLLLLAFGALSAGK